MVMMKTQVSLLVLISMMSSLSQPVFAGKKRKIEGIQEPNGQEKNGSSVTKKKTVPLFKRIKEEKEEEEFKNSSEGQINLTIIKIEKEEEEEEEEEENNPELFSQAFRINSTGPLFRVTREEDLIEQKVVWDILAGRIQNKQLKKIDPRSWTSLEEKIKKDERYLYAAGRIFIEKNESPGFFAFSLWNLGTLAEVGSIGAQLVLGKMYEKGWGVGKHEDVAVKWYQQAADQGSAIAQCNLGFMYGNGVGIDKDEKKAASLFQLAADQGYARAQFNLGCLYEYGVGVDRDKKKAASLFQLAADQAFAIAQFKLGYLYEHGAGVDLDLEKAASLYQLAADQGIARAQFYLARMYKVGLGVDKDDKKAASLFQLAADQGFASAQSDLGTMYHSGVGVDKDELHGLMLFLQAKDYSKHKILRMQLQSLLTEPFQEKNFDEKLLFRELDEAFHNLLQWSQFEIGLNNPSQQDQPGVKELRKIYEPLEEFHLNFFPIFKDINQKTMPAFLVTCVALTGQWPDSPYVSSHRLENKVFLSVGEKNVKRAKGIIKLISSKPHPQKEFSYEESPEFCHTLASVVLQQTKIIALNTLMDQMIEADPRYEVPSKSQKQEKGKEKEKEKEEEVKEENFYSEEYFIQKRQVMVAKQLIDNLKKDEPEYRLLKAMKVQEIETLEERRKHFSESIAFSEIKSLEDALHYCQKILSIYMGGVSLLNTGKNELIKGIADLESLGIELNLISSLIVKKKMELNVYDQAAVHMGEKIEQTKVMLGYYKKIQEYLKTFVFDGVGKRNGEFRKEWPFLFPQEGQLYSS